MTQRPPVQRLFRLIRFALPLLLLLLSLVVYLTYVRPLSASTKERKSKLLEKNRTLLQFIEEKGFYPMQSTLEKLTHSEKILNTALKDYLENHGPDRDQDQNIDAILKEWGYPEESKLAVKLKSLKQGVLNGLKKTKPTELALRRLGLCLCKAGVEDVDKMAFIPVENACFSLDGDLSAFDVEFLFSAGLTEAMHFMTDLFFLPSGGILVQPVFMTFQRIETAQWIGDLNQYSGPPARFELRARFIFTVDKG